MRCSKDESCVLVREDQALSEELDMKSFKPQQQLYQKKIWVLRWIGCSQWKVGAICQEPSQFWTVISNCFKKKTRSSENAEPCLTSSSSSLWSMHGNENRIRERYGWWPCLFPLGFSNRKSDPRTAALAAGMTSDQELQSHPSNYSTPMVQARSFEHGPVIKPGPGPHPH
ncbi:hypothetical protein O6H91_07G098700 [Diphasiastrum complanatum]|uniref:Uncharacterized protein n=1 Tax=Diphasiastrum complanatum TaxID=34168 RepID=A0ACC2D7S7_DIPCM|nr:hypothetical protein O6H91_07G098700 [Diphasiastrum complanatum]